MAQLNKQIAELKAKLPPIKEGKQAKQKAKQSVIQETEEIKEVELKVKPLSDKLAEWKVKEVSARQRIDASLPKP